MEFIHGVMAGNMKANINMIKNMDLVYIHGLMRENMKVNGVMESMCLIYSVFL